jgi:pimeloyl-ACP methyl ester carboxylesterase
LIIKARSGTMHAAVNAFLPADALAPGPHRAEVFALLEDMAANIGTSTMIRQARALQRRKDQQATLRKCRAPALVLCGQHDTLTPVKRHSFMAELIPYARLEVIANAGHLPTLEDPDTTTRALLEWMKQPLVLR